MNTQKMKKVTLLVAVAIMVIGTSTYAQRGRNCDSKGQGFNRAEMCERIPDLTEDQKTKIEDLRLEQMKEMTNHRNQMDELRAKKRTLMTSDNADMKEINSVIDQMTSLQNKRMKASAKHRQEVRSLLTEEQKVYFDAMPRHRRGHGKGMKQGRGNMQGPGYGRGHGMGQGSGANYQGNN